MARRGALGWCVALATALSFLSGCAAYHERMAAVDEALARGQADKALEALDADGHRAGGQDRPLYLMNRAMILRLRGDLEGAIRDLSEAARLTEEAAVISVSEQAAAATVNEGRRSYAGAPYERRLIHVFLALSYLELGRLEDARVEALQIDLISRALAEKGEPEDPFARWLAGTVFEALGEWSDARIAYDKALAAYTDEDSPYALPPPRQLQRDLVRATRALGLADEARRLRERFHLVADDPALDPEAYARQGELIFVYLDNLAPLWRETNTLVQATEDGHLVRIALPYAVPRPSPVERARVRADDHEATAERAEDIARLSVTYLEGQMPKLVARAIVRAVAKEKAVDKVQQEGGAVLGLMMNIATVASERADTRSWSLLPDNVRLARLPLPPGTYPVQVILEDRDGRVLARRDLGEIFFRAGDKRWRSFHWIDPRITRWWAVPPDPEWVRIHIHGG